MLTNKIVENMFFFGLLGGAAYLVWQLFSPFIGALALAAIIVTICYPLYTQVLKITPRHNKSVASLLSVFLVILIVVIPLLILGSFIFKEALSVYSLFNTNTQVSFIQSLSNLEVFVTRFVPSFSLDISNFVQQIASFIASHLIGIFTGAASTIFLFFIALIASFYFFRDGKEFTSYLIKISPLEDAKDNIILNRLANAVRSVALGTIFVALVQGSATAIGLSIFGFNHAVLWGSVAAIGALIPGVGTTIVFVPAVAYLLITGDYFTASGVAVWGALGVGLIDNLLGPYVMSRGNSLHPLLILLSVLGGIVLMGPIGFIIGPVILSLFTVLLELYAQHLSAPQ